MLEKIGSGLKAALRKITKAGYIDESVVDELVRDIQRTLLSGDVNVKLVFELTKKIKRRSLNEKPKKGITAREHIVNIVYEELVDIVGEKAEISLTPKKILLCGLFGNGKTTTAAKLAVFYRKKGLKPAFIACDVVRPAAYEQLQQLGEQNNVPFFGIKGEKDSSVVLKEGLKKIKADIIIIDSSGRDALSKDMINEIKKLNEIAKPEEKILVIGADIGQAAGEQAKAFHEALGVTGIIITKMDATAKGGGALTSSRISNAPVKFITVGEKVDALELFDPQRFISRLIGFGDLQGLLEKTKDIMDPKKAGEVAERLKSGKFTMEDFYEQLKSVGKMGSLESMMNMIPGMGAMKMPKKFDPKEQEAKMKKWKVAIESMSKKEREDPDIINTSRVTRIANGSGLEESDIRSLLKNYKQAKKVVKMMSKGGSERGMMSKLMRKFKGFKM